MSQGDPFKTLFVARLSYDVTERKLSREFEEFGPIKNIRLVHEKNSGEALLRLGNFISTASSSTVPKNEMVSYVKCRRPIGFDLAFGLFVSGLANKLFARTGKYGGRILIAACQRALPEF